MAEDKLRTMRELVDKLNFAANAYYNGQGEHMSYYEWDALFDEVKRLEKETGQQLVALYLYRYKACDLPHFLPMGKVASLYRNIVEYGW